MFFDSPQVNNVHSKNINMLLQLYFRTPWESSYIELIIAVFLA